MIRILQVSIFCSVISTDHEIVNIGVCVGHIRSRLVLPVQHVHLFIGLFSIKLDI